MKKNLIKKINFIGALSILSLPIFLGVSFDLSKNYTNDKSSFETLTITNTQDFYNYFNVEESTHFYLQSSIDYSNYLSNVNQTVSGIASLSWVSNTNKDIGFVVDQNPIGTTEGIVLRKSLSTSFDQIVGASESNEGWIASIGTYNNTSSQRYEMLVNANNNKVAFSAVSPGQEKRYLSNPTNENNVAFFQTSSSLENADIWFNIIFDLDTPTSQLPPYFSEFDVSIKQDYIAEFKIKLQSSYVGKQYFALVPNIEDRSINSDGILTPKNIVLDLTPNVEKIYNVDYSPWANATNFTYELLIGGTGSKYRFDQDVNFIPSAVNSVISQANDLFDQNEVSVDFILGQTGNVIEYRVYQIGTTPSLSPWVEISTPTTGIYNINLTNLDIFKAYSIDVQLKNIPGSISTTNIRKSVADNIDDHFIDNKLDTSANLNFNYVIGSNISGASSSSIEYRVLDLVDWTQIPQNAGSDFIVLDNLTPSTEYTYEFRSVYTDQVSQKTKLIASDKFKTLSTENLDKHSEISNLKITNVTLETLSYEFDMIEGGIFNQLVINVSSPLSIVNSEFIEILENERDRLTGKISLSVDFVDFIDTLGNQMNFLSLTDYYLGVFSQPDFDTPATGGEFTFPDDRENIIDHTIDISSTDISNIDKVDGKINYDVKFNVLQQLNFARTLTINLLDNTKNILQTQNFDFNFNFSQEGSFEDLDQGVYYIQLVIGYSGFDNENISKPDVHFLKFTSNPQRVELSPTLPNPSIPEIIINLNSLIVGNNVVVSGYMNFVPRQVNGIPIANFNLSQSYINFFLKDENGNVIKEEKVSLVEVNSFHYTISYTSSISNLDSSLFTLTSIGFTPYLYFSYTNSPTITQIVPLGVILLTDNTNLELIPFPIEPDSSNNIWIWIGISIGIVVVLGLLIWFLISRRNKKIEDQLYEKTEKQNITN